MIRSVQDSARVAIPAVVEQILASGEMSRQQHLQLTSAMLADRQINEEDRRQINRVLDYIQTGRIKLVN